MSKRFRIGLFGLLAVLALVAAACGNDDDSAGDSTPEPTEAATQAPAPTEAATQAPAPEAPELVIGSVMPETGTLSFLSLPMVTSIELAVEDIQAAGGNVRLLSGDTGTDPDVASEAVNRLLGEGAHVIVGAASSGISQSFIQTLSDAQIPQCSPSNTSPSFTTQDNADFYFRSSPPDQAAAPILADLIASGGGTKTAIIARADDWGNALSMLLADNLTELGVESEILSYEEEASNFAPTIAAVEAMGADSVGLISFAEGAQIIRGLLEAGVPADVIYGADGIYDSELPSQVDPSNPNVVDGFVAITPASTAGDVGQNYDARLGAITGGELTYGGHSYDCVIIVALASLAAGSTEGPDIITQVPLVTSGGQKCFNYEECAGLIDDGEDIDYDGASGPLELNEVGDPSFARYDVAQFVDGELTVIDSLDVDLS